MILNKCIWFISQIYKALCYECQSAFKIPALTINFALYRKHPARFATAFNAQDTSESLRTKKKTLVDAPHKVVKKT